MRQAAGFTLLETLVALAVTGLLFAALSAALGFGLGPVRDRSARTEAGMRDAPVADFLRALIEDARLTRSAPNAAVLFRGAADGLTLAAAPPVLAMEGGVQSVRLAIENGGLSVRWTPLDANGGPGGETMLLPGASRLKLRYFGRLQLESGPGWHDAWTSAARLPSLISITLTGPNTSHLPEIIAAPRTALAD